MKLYAKQRLLADLENPLGDGVVFDTLVDGDPEVGKPLLQTLTDDDGGFSEPSEQPLLNDDLPV
jgi:hypothetical protein